MKEAAVISMGTEVSDEDMLSIKALSEQVITLSEYRAQLYEYLRSRMNAIAPNLTIVVGELVGACLIAHTGSLVTPWLSILQALFRFWVQKRYVHSSISSNLCHIFVIAFLPVCECSSAVVLQHLMLFV